MQKQVEQKYFAKMFREKQREGNKRELYTEKQKFSEYCILRQSQCDQIWRNFATLAKISESLWQFFESFI